MVILNNIQNRLNRIIRKTIYKNKIPKYINVKYINKTVKQYAPVKIDYDNYSEKNIKNLIITNHRRMWMWISRWAHSPWSAVCPARVNLRWSMGS